MEFIVILLLLVFLELGYFRLADKYNIIDRPNLRSSHNYITLRGGGILFYFSVCLYYLFFGFSNFYFFLGLSLITIVSFLDDIYTLSSKKRIIAQLLAVILLIYQWHLLQDYLLFILPIVFLIIGIINAYNFMDGINGMTGCYSLVVVFLLEICNRQVQFIDSNLLACISLGILVFLFFNFRKKAKTFAGDVGSVSIAFIICFLLGSLILATNNFIYLLFLVVYGVDVIWTFLKRLRAKENVFEAHRSHLYQYLGNEMNIDKLCVSIIYSILQLVIGLMVIYLSILSYKIQLVGGFFIVLFLSLIYLKMKKIVIKKYVK